MVNLDFDAAGQLLGIECLDAREVRKGGPERERFSDPDASWGHRSAVSTRKGGGSYGCKLQLAVCKQTGFPLAWRAETAKHHESNFRCAAS